MNLGIQTGDKNWVLSSGEWMLMIKSVWIGGGSTHTHRTWVEGTKTTVG